MNTGRGQRGPSLGDVASDFKAKWEAGKSVAVRPASTVDAGEHRSEGRREVQQLLRSWRSGGAEVKVTRGVSTGREHRKKKPGRQPPHRQSPVVPAAPASVAQTTAKPAGQAPLPETKSWQERLGDVSADVRELKISADEVRPCTFSASHLAVQADRGRRAILGLDFGTAFTKAVVNWSGRHHAVDWGEAVDVEDHYLLPSVFSEARDGRCVLGVPEGAEWSLRDGIKLRLISSNEDEATAEMADAVIFIALVFRYVDSWLRRQNRTISGGIDWRLHVGLPTRSWDKGPVAAVFRRVTQASRVLACMEGQVTREAALDALDRADEVSKPQVNVFPEFACQLYSYLQSPERGDDLHALVDIGAGTLDVAYFNVFVKEGDTVLPVFASAVEKLGAHYLIAALAGKGSEAVWNDNETGLSNEAVAQKLGCTEADVSIRRSVYLNSVAKVLHAESTRARGRYRNSPAFRDMAAVRLFLCGGGSRIPCLQKRFGRIARESAEKFGVRYLVSSLVAPANLVGKLEGGFDRISVAYGLSQLAANIGDVMRSGSLEPLAPMEHFVGKDRDDDR